ncbi:MAG: 4-hydroxybenzoate octaprenyltransferase [Alphaproteobacteria bacterium]|nr:4-hydroxybenzoate octaprenyltransferase [Alphaproteobacteria bacterium]
MTHSFFTDIRRTGWVETLPPVVQPYARLMRLDRPIGTWLLLLPCWWGVALASDTFPNLWYMVLFGLGSVIMRGAGCVVNDIYDRNLDRLVERTSIRPLASGEIKLWQACLFLAGLLTLGLGILLLFNKATIILGVSSLILVFTYPLMKRITFWPQLFLGFTFNWGVLLGGMAVQNTLTLPIILAYLAGVLWTLGYDTVYAHQDKRDDELADIKSTALLFGENSLRWVALFYTISLALLALAGWAAGLGQIYHWGLIVAACYALVRLILWKMDDPASCLSCFKSNRDFGLIILLAIILDKLA